MHESTKAGIYSAGPYVAMAAEKDPLFCQPMVRRRHNTAADAVAPTNPR